VKRSHQDGTMLSPGRGERSIEHRRVVVRMKDWNPLGLESLFQAPGETPVEPRPAAQEVDRDLTRIEIGRLVAKGRVEDHDPVIQTSLPRLPCELEHDTFLSAYFEPAHEVDQPRWTVWIWHRVLVQQRYLS